TTMCAVVAATGSFVQLALISASATLVVYLICCLGVFSLRRRNVTSADAPFVAPGGPVVPLAAAGIIVWILSALAAQELAAAASLVAVSGVVYSVHAMRQGNRRDEQITAGETARHHAAHSFGDRI